MTYEEIKDALDGLYAYDLGSTDSGIHDAILKEKVRAHIQGLDPREHKALIVRLCRYMLSDEVLEQGYTAEDLKGFLVWLDEEMGCLIS